MADVSYLSEHGTGGVALCVSDAPTDGHRVVEMSEVSVNEMVVAWLFWNEQVNAFVIKNNAMKIGSNPDGTTYPSVLYPKGRQMGRTRSLNLSTDRRSLTTAMSPWKSSGR